MILAHQDIMAMLVCDPETGKLRQLVEPFHERARHNGMSYGCGPHGYDVRCKQRIVLPPGGFSLASTVEHFVTPDHLMFLVKDKSTWARRGLSVFNTVGEAGWYGWLTLELKNQGPEVLVIEAGDPIAQILWQRLTQPTAQPYGNSKYQGQGDAPVAAILEGVNQ